MEYIVIKGQGKATETLKYQMSKFHLPDNVHLGTINVLPKIDCVPDYTINDMEWYCPFHKKNHTETFGFKKIEFIFNGKPYTGHIYMPGNSENKDCSEIITNHIDGLKYGDKLCLKKNTV